MVSFKKFFLATSLLLSGVAAAPSQLGTEFNVLEKRAIYEITDANKICENQYVTPMTISGNSGSATVVDLTGCTALFFFGDNNVLRRVVHILCGNEEADAKTAAADAGGSTYVAIAVANVDAYNAASAGVKAGRSTIEIGAEVIYPTNGLGNQGVTIKGTTGSRVLEQDRADKVCGESGVTK